MTGRPPVENAPDAAVYGHRPRPVTLAVGLLALVAANSFAGPLLPGSEGEIAVGIVGALVATMAAVGLVRMRRWGYLAAIVVAALNVLAELPAFVVLDGALLRMTAAASVVACVLIIALVTRPEARRAYV